MNTFCIAPQKIKRTIWAFTLVELLVVISIIALLVAILMPALGRARQQAQALVCMTHLRTIGQAEFLYAADYDDKLAFIRSDSPQNTGFFWAAILWAQFYNESIPTMNDYFTRPPIEHPEWLTCPSQKKFGEDGQWDEFTWSDVRFVIDGGVWPHKKPGIIFSFDDGAITNYTIAAPLLKEYGFQAIFLIVPDWVDCQIEEQTQYAKEHSISSPADYLESPRKAMSWEQVANLSKQGHAIASHTRTHHRFTSQDSPRRIKDEVERSRMIFTERIGITPEIFSWVGGEISVYQPAVYKAVLEAGYNYTLSTCAMPLQAGVHPHLVGRTALASSFPVSLVRLVLLPSYDGKYAIKDSKIRSRFGIERRLS